MKFSQLVQQLGLTPEVTSLRFAPDLDPDLLGVSAVEAAAKGQLSFIESERYSEQLQSTAASGLILPESEKLQELAMARQIAWVATPHPRLRFAQAIALFYQPFRLPATIHPTAVIDPTASLGENVAIGAYVTIGAGVKIGAGCCIHPQVVIYPEAEIGDGTVLHAHCVIHERSRIGPNCVIHSGAVIGSEGFGFVPTPEGWFKMEQSGCTVLEAGVEVGCNSAIDRPAVGETRIRRGTKIDNLVQIGHGCQIGENCAIAGQTGLAGRVQLGAGVVLAGQVGIADGVKLGTRAIATSRAGVVRDVGAGETVSGHPAIPHKSFLRAANLYHRLPELYQIVKRLQGKNDQAK
uniref:UDP-3-O-acylglucosamine N-acyltransferase n=1 Tax=Cyanothece sp. (strain PCC 7425 / ATCC 29141) TaxID=395961 RepID=B8HXT3_CYAP4